MIAVQVLSNYGLANRLTRLRNWRASAGVRLAYMDTDKRASEALELVAAIGRLDQMIHSTARAIRRRA